ncbi:MAG TPA: alpha/beta fold hydrolase [Nannocystaceae bacterium]|nr:alpha/beta fold hydrolase [Nannocystaceae bacterium]
MLIGGMTQTLASWGAQIRPLSERREVVAYEARGQGMTELALDDCTLPRHVEDFAALHEALALGGPVDLCGFSFGGRVALAIAAERPELVHRLVLSGVALDRGLVGRLIVRGWLAALATGNLEALARVSLPDILGPTYLEANAALIEPMVRASIERNRYDGVLALMRGTIDLPEGSPWTAGPLAARIRAHGIAALCTGGALDRLAPPDEVAALADALVGEHVTIAGAGHTIAIETPQTWRDHALAFLDRDE